MGKINCIALLVLSMLAQEAIALSCVKSSESPSHQLAQYFNRADLVARVRRSELYASFDARQVWKGEPSAGVNADGYLQGTGEFVLFAVYESGNYETIGTCLSVANLEQLLNLEHGPGVPPPDNAVPYLDMLLLVCFSALFGIGLVMWSTTHNWGLEAGVSPTNRSN